MADLVELATIWLVDLVGSTRLATSVGAVRADELRDEYFALLREAIEASRGKEFKNTGDGLCVAFSSASAAIRCAVSTQQLFELRYRRAEQPLHVRIGLATGEATVQDGDYFGVPSIVAARLCDRAPADGILVCSLTKTLAGRVDSIRFESVGELELKGMPESVEAFAVVWEPLADEVVDSVARWPLPAALRSVPSVSYVGRMMEREWIERARGAARAGDRRVVLLSGEPGIGKTRLASYAALSAHGDGFAVCWGACSEDLSVPYEPWIGVCSHLVEHAPDDLLADHAARFGGELSRLARNLPARVSALPEPQTTDLETERFLLFSAVAGLLAELSELTPVCLVLDDFHWADGQSVALLKHAARTIEQGRLQVLVTYRDSDLSKDHPLTAALADLRRIDGVERIALTGLGEDEVAEILAIAAGHGLDRAGMQLAGEIASETDGNPFFVLEIVRNLSASGLAVFDEARGRWRIDRSSGVGLPASIRDVVERRVALLGEQEQYVLTAAAVIGRSFDVALLARLVESSEAAVLDSLEAAVSAALLTESAAEVGRFSFAHALISATLYEGLGRTRRALLHQRVAEALEDLCGANPGDRVGELAHHWAAAMVPARAEKAIEYARRAGEQSLERLVPDDAARWFTQALELIDRQPEADPRERTDALIGLGEARRDAGGSFRRTLLDASQIALELNDVDRLTRAVLANNRGRNSFYARLDEQRIELLQAAVDRTPETEAAIRARLLTLLSLELAYHPDHNRRRTLSDEALQLARHSGDARALAQVLRDRPYVIWAPGALAERTANVAELLELAGQLDDPVTSYWAHVNQMDVQVESASIENARTALTQCTAIADHVGQPTLRWSAATQSAALATLNGSSEEIKDSAERAFQLSASAAGRETQPAEQLDADSGTRVSDAAMSFGVQIFHYHWWKADWDALVALFGWAAKDLPDIAAFHGTQGVVYCESGQIDRARRILEEASTRGFDRIPRDPLTTSALSWYAMLASGLKDARVATSLLEQLTSVTERVAWNGFNAYGAIDCYRGMLAATLGHNEQADSWLSTGIELNDRIGAAMWATRARLFWAEQLAQRGGAELTARAAALFVHARSAADTLGASALVQRADSGLAVTATR